MQQFIKILNFRNDEELCSQLPFTPSDAFIKFIKGTMDNQTGLPIDGLYICFPEEKLVNGKMKDMKSWEMGWMPHYSKGNKNAAFDDGLDYFLNFPEKYKRLESLPMVTALTKFEAKAKEMGYEKIGLKKYKHPDGRQLAFKEQYKDGGTKAMWIEAMVQGFTVVYTGEGAQKIADRLVKEHIKMFTQLETFLTEGVIHGE